MMITSTTFAAGSVIEVRDKEWIVSSCERAGDGWKVRCIGSSELVPATPATFYGTLDEIEALDPAGGELGPGPVAAVSRGPHFPRSRFTASELRRHGVPESLRSEYGDAVNGLANLQLLQGLVTSRNQYGALGVARVRAVPFDGGPRTLRRA
ncbi:MAG: hypothetical protein ACRDRD_17400, partial [Pseudonocardiaceae bacterium]